MKKIFISYSEFDKPRVKTLEAKFNSSYGLKPIVIANDREALKQLTEKVKNGIFECDYFVPVLTSNSINTQWINQEIGYASAMNKEILPIIEKGIIDNLKGFIHKNIDLPYLFEVSVSNDKLTRKKYRACCDLLIADLISKNQTATIESVFPGKWRSEFKEGNMRGVVKDMEFKGMKLFEDGKHVFNIDNVYIDFNANKIRFTKVGFDGYQRLENNLHIVQLEQKYTGTESGTVKITYFKK